MVNQIHTEDLCFTLFRDAKKHFLILAIDGKRWSSDYVGMECKDFG